MYRRVRRWSGATMLVIGLAACTSSKHATIPPGPTRPPASATTICPDWRVDQALDGYEVVDRKLTALTKTLLGRDAHYRRGAARVRISTGVDVEGQLEDLDFAGDEVQRGNRTITVLKSVIVSRMLLASWHEPGRSGPCAKVTVTTQDLDEASLLAILDDLVIAP